MRQFLAFFNCRRRPVLWIVIVISLFISFGAILKLKNGPEHQYLVPEANRDQFTDVNGKFSLINGAKGRSSKSTAEHSITRGSSTSHRYVIGMNYWEQFTNALRNFFALACIADQWEVSIVQPFTAHSRLYGLDNVFLDDYINSSDTALDLSLILNPVSMESVLKERGLQSMSTLEQMLRYGDRKLVFLHFISIKPAHEYSIKTESTRNFLTNAFKRTGIVDCSNQQELLNLARLVSSNLNSILSHLQLNRDGEFYAQKYFCINMTSGLTPSELATQIELGSGNVSIIVVNWRGLSNGSKSVHSSKGIHPSNRLVIVNDRECTGHKHLKTFNLEFSQTILDAGKRFMEELAMADQQFIVVHFRSEKLSFRQTRFPRFMPNCVFEGIQMRDKILNEVGVVNGRSLRVLYFGDIGPYGSETCKRCKSVNEMKRLLEKYQIELTHFSPSKYNLPLDRGLVAAVEMSVMSHASHMILIGGGAYQTQLQVRFERRQQSKNKAIIMCTTDQQAIEITQRFSPSQH